MCTVVKVAISLEALVFGRTASEIVRKEKFVLMITSVKSKKLNSRSSNGHNMLWMTLRPFFRDNNSMPVKM